MNGSLPAIPPELLHGSASIHAAKAHVAGELRATVTGIRSHRRGPAFEEETDGV